jgi:thiamine-phosphate pyrophosphorylase
MPPPSEPSAQGFPNPSPCGRLLVILDGPTLRALGRTPRSLAAALRGIGPFGLWYRDHELRGPDSDVAATELGATLGEGGPQLIVGAGPRTALRIGAGAHLGAAQTIPARRPRPLGRSCHSVAEVRAAAAAGQDYATLSPIWETSSFKPEARPTLGVEVLAEAARGTSMPLFALGGVTPERVAACLDAGAHGVAVLGAICAAREPVDVVHALLDAIERHI